MMEETIHEIEKPKELVPFFTSSISAGLISFGLFMYLIVTYVYLLFFSVLDIGILDIVFTVGLLYLIHKTLWKKERLSFLEWLGFSFIFLYCLFYMVVGFTIGYYFSYYY